MFCTILWRIKRKAAVVVRSEKNKFSMAHIKALRETLAFQRPVIGSGSVKSQVKHNEAICLVSHYRDAKYI
jgi:hypothetical protein